MKKILSIGLLGLFLGACSSQDVPENTGTTSEGSRFMTIRIASTNTVSRTEYDDGSEDEYAVDKNHVAFFFFNDKGEAVSVTDDGKNYLTGERTITWATDDESKQTVSSNSSLTNLSEVMLVLNQQKSVDTPSQVVVVLNSPITFSDDSYSLDDLKGQALTSGTVEVGGTTYYTMSNSVYYDGTKAVYATPIPPSALATSVDAAKDKAVTIYVERVVSKVQVDEANNMSFTVDGTNKTIDFVGSDGTTKTTSEELTIQINGWGLFNELSEALLLKDVSNFSASDTWANDDTNHRSYWGKTPDTYSSSDTKVKWSSLDGMSARYTLPNTLEATTTTNGDGTTETTDVNTSIYVAATIGTGTGNDFKALTITKWLSQYYTEENLKKVIAKYLANSLYYKDGTDVKSITDGDIAFTSKDLTAGIDSDASGNGYKVTVTLSTVGKDKTWYSDKDATTQYNSNDEVQKSVLNGVPKPQIWNGGKCYYFTTVKHTPKGDNVPGVVRNHWYQIEISAIQGLGTPVFDENEDIDPTVPDNKDDYWYLAAKVGVQAWRLVKQSTTLTSN